jgi:hypothetical protein
MRCPYCASEVPQEATVCARCSRDLYLVQRLQERIESLERELAEQAKKIVTGDEKPLAAPPDPATTTAAPPAAAAAGSNSRSYWESLLLALVPALVLLLAAHAVLLFAYDMKPLYLRIASIMIPIPFGFAMLVWHPRRMGISSVAGFIMALAAVFLMLVTTSRIDHVPVLPQDAREVREVLEYVASIGLAFLTGLLLGELRYHRLSITPRPGRTTVFLAQLFTSDKEGELGIIKMASRIQKLVSTMTPVVTGAASVYAGVKALLGDDG